MKKRTLALLIGLFSSLLFVPSAHGLSDIEAVVFEDEIRYLLEEEIISGHPDGTYKPFDNITRAAFSKIVALAAFEGEINEDNTKCFPDLEGLWFDKYVCTLKDKGVINGYPDGNFIPANNINFAETAKIISNAFDLKASEPTPQEQWYDPFVNKLDEYKAIPFNLKGADQKIDRSQMAFVIYSVLNPNLPPEGLEQVTHCQWPGAPTYDYFKDDEKVYYTPTGYYQDYDSEGFPELEEADPQNLEVIACEVLKDDEHVYSLAKKTTLDGASFELFSGQNFEFGLLYTYAKDEDGVYYFQTVENKPIIGVDTASFEVLEQGHFKDLGPSFYGFAKDKDGGYVEGAAIPGSDGESFTLIAENIAYDESNLYVSKGNLLQIYEELSATPLLNMSASEFINESESYLEGLNYEIYQTTQVSRAGGESLTIDWYKQ